jgi:ABC-type dipeptide/oligopeptide/nickel transport system ATPase component
MRRARAAAAAAQARAAAAEAAEGCIGGKLIAAEQRVHAREEQCRRLQAQQAHAELKMVRMPRVSMIFQSCSPSRRPSCVINIQAEEHACLRQQADSTCMRGH